MDLTRTRILGVMGELASFSGLKLNTAPRILFVVVGRVRTMMARAFSVASTVKTSLRGGRDGLAVTLSSPGVSFLPAVLLQAVEHPVEQARSLGVEGSMVQRLVVLRHLVQ